MFEQTGKCALEGQTNAFGKGVPDQENPARRRLQRHVAGRGVLEAEIVGDEPVARFAPDIVAVEFGSKAVVIDGVVDARSARLLLSAREGGIGEVEDQEQPRQYRNIAELSRIRRGAKAALQKPAFGGEVA